ncbi:MAG TPA: HNH endonuclease signature motif containing protein [Myxococcales bacterium]
MDNGFDQDLPGHEQCLGFGSTHAPLRLWLSAIEDGPVLLAVLRLNVAKALAEQGGAVAMPLPEGAVASLATGLARRRGAAPGRAPRVPAIETLPDELLHAFEAKTSGMPRATEVDRVVVERVGQDLLREGLMDYWDGRCAVTGLAVPELLRASHIKPWADCETDAERLDVYNGLLLAPHPHAAFDRGSSCLRMTGRCGRRRDSTRRRAKPCTSTRK